MPDALKNVDGKTLIDHSVLMETFWVILDDEPPARVPAEGEIVELTCRWHSRPALIPTSMWSLPNSLRTEPVDRGYRIYSEHCGMEAVLPSMDETHVECGSDFFGPGVLHTDPYLWIDTHYVPRFRATVVELANICVAPDVLTGQSERAPSVAVADGRIPDGYLIRYRCARVAPESVPRTTGRSRLMDIVLDSFIDHFHHLASSHEPDARLLLAGYVGTTVVLILEPSPTHATGLVIGVAEDGDWERHGDEPAIDIVLRHYLEPGWGLPFDSDQPEASLNDATATDPILWDSPGSLPPLAGLPRTVSELTRGRVPEGFVGRKAD